VGARIVTNTLAQRILYLSGEEIEPMREVMAELMAYEEVQRHLVGMVTGLDIRYDVGPGEHPLLGRRLPGADLTADSAGDFAGGSGPDGSAPTFEFLHAGRGVVLDLAGNEDVRDVAAGWADLVHVVTATSRPDGALKDVEAALVRPDGYIAWIGFGGSGVSGLADALTRWFGAARATAVPASAQAKQSL
jgi:bifunctional hydroxylase/dehydrase